MPSVMRDAKRKLGDGAYLSVGAEVPPRRGASFSMRYTGVGSLREGWALVHHRMKSPRRRVNDIGELVMFSENGTHKVVVGGYIRRGHGKLTKFLGSGSLLMSGEGKPARVRHATHKVFGMSPR